MKDLIIISLFVTLCTPGFCQSEQDSVLIIAAAHDYIKGWYEGDEARMEKAIHPKLAKRAMIFYEEIGQPLFVETTALELVQQTRNGGGTSTPEDLVRTDVTILDIFQNAASVRIDAHAWIDYLHLMKSNGQWQIVNVLWEIRDPKHDR